MVFAGHSSVEERRYQVRYSCLQRSIATKQRLDSTFRHWQEVQHLVGAIASRLGSDELQCL